MNNKFKRINNLKEIINKTEDKFGNNIAYKIKIEPEKYNDSADFFAFFCFKLLDSSFFLFPERQTEKKRCQRESGGAALRSKGERKSDPILFP